jgi:NADH:ubiquinone reductase (H+-translocating)
VVGASFTGVEVLHQLRKRGVLPSIETVVVDRRAEHAYIPLVHELVAGEVDRAQYVLQTAQYVRSLPGCTYLVDTVVSIDPMSHEATLASGASVRARAIVLALGSTVEQPERFGAVGQALGIKFLEQSDTLRRRLLTTASGTVLVIGGGITGVEMASELAMYCKRSPKALSVTLVEGAERLLSAASSSASQRTLRLLRQMGVEVLLNARVRSIDAQRVSLSQHTSSGVVESALEPAFVIWAGGIRPSALTRQFDVLRDEDGWIVVDPTLSCQTSSGNTARGVFAGGDAVRVYDVSGRWPTVPRAIECIWQGKVLARNVAIFLSATRRSLSPEAGSNVNLVRHTLVRDFPYGISLGRHSLVMYGRCIINLRAVGVAFRRWLMRRYMARYR